MGFAGGGDRRREKGRTDMILRCRLCHASIAAFDPADLRLPLLGAMFGPLESGFPPPFDPEVAFVHARCPYCGHHPQGYEPAGADSLETDAGAFVLAATPATPAAPAAKVATTAPAAVEKKVEAPKAAEAAVRRLALRAPYPAFCTNLG